MAKSNALDDMTRESRESEIRNRYKEICRFAEENKWFLLSHQQENDEFYPESYFPTQSGNVVRILFDMDGFTVQNEVYFSEPI